MALTSRTSARLDPVLSHNFVIGLVDTSSTLAILASASLAAVFDAALGGFSECTGLDMSLKTEDYREGGYNGAVLRFPTRVEWGNITLKKGVAGTELWDWHYGFVEGSGKRRDGVIALMTAEQRPRNVWYFRRGLPVKYTGPQMNAAQSGVAVESLEIAHEGLQQIPLAAALGTAASTAVAPFVG